MGANDSNVSSLVRKLRLLKLSLCLRWQERGALVAPRRQERGARVRVVSTSCPDFSESVCTFVPEERCRLPVRVAFVAFTQPDS